MKFIDSHCHLHDERVIGDTDGILERAESAGIRHMASCATMEENFEITARLSRKYHSILPFFGIHPWFVGSRSDNWKELLMSYLQGSQSGIGETGLDFTNKAWDQEEQIQVFQEHLGLAKELKLPINIHIRKAWDTFIHILKKTGKLSVTGMVHSYSGSADMVSVLEKYNLYISFSGSVTNPSAKKVVQALKKVSKNHFVLETDSPDINPYLDGEKIKSLNEPENLPAIAKIASERIGMDAEKFIAQAYDNSRRLFSPLLKEKEDV